MNISSVGLCHDFGRRWVGFVTLGGIGRFLRFVVKQIQGFGTGHLAQHGQGQRVGQAVVIDVDVQAVHHIEMRISKQFFHGGVFHLGRHTAGHESREVRLRRQLLGLCQGGARLGRNRRSAICSLSRGSRCAS